MIPTKEELEKLKLAAILEDGLDKYVYLREDEKGRYIEYAFQEGCPHNNRCLSWYDKPHPKAWLRNGDKEEDIEWRTKRLHNIDELYYLDEYACSNQNKEGDEKCCAGHPRKECYETWAKNWTEEEPVKCACWTLREPTIPTKILIPIEKVLKLKDKLLEND